MARQSSTLNTADEIEQVEELMRDLEKRLSRLNGIASRTSAGVGGAADRAGEAVAAALNDISLRLREGARAAGDEVGKLGTDTLKRISDEVEHRPLMTLAIAAGIGFLAGVVGRR